MHVIINNNNNMATAISGYGVMTLNMKGESQGQGSAGARRDLIIELLEREKPDVIFGQECVKDLRSWT